MRDPLKFAVLGAGHGGHAMSADLTLKGFEVNLFELKELEENIIPIKERGGIEITSVSPLARTGFAKISKVTTDVKEAVEDVDIICQSVPAYAHMAFFKTFAPHLEDGQIVVIWPDNWGCLRLVKYMKDKGIKRDVIVAGTASLIYACRRVGPAQVWVRRVKEVVPVAALPAKETAKTVEALKKAWPEIVAGKNSIEMSLNNTNFTEHPPCMILNAARIEATKGDFNIWKEGFDQPSVKKLTKALNRERMKVCEALGVFDDWYSKFYVTQPLTAERFFKKEVKTRISGVPQATPDRAPDTLNFRYITEDVPYGLVPIASLGDLLGVPTPAIKAVILIASIIMDTDYWKEGLTVEKLGLSPSEIIKVATE